MSLIAGTYYKADNVNWVEVLTGACHFGSIGDIIVIMVFREEL